MEEQFEKQVDKRVNQRVDRRIRSRPSEVLTSRAARTGGLILKCAVLLVVVSLFCACGRKEVVRVETVTREVVLDNTLPPPPGIVQYVWEEPMVDFVEVPPGLDPEGIYYRPYHKAVVEVRQGRWRYYDAQREPVDKSKVPD